MSLNPKLNPSWMSQLETEFAQPYMANLKKFLSEEYRQKKIIFPRGPEFFKALNETPFDQVRVVILGQDPYHGEGQAHGLAFSVPRGVAIPPSLRNIYKELKSDLGLEPPSHGCLEAWSRQGVLLLNSVLSVEQGQAASHQGQGWEQLTDVVIQRLNEHRQGLVFVLWGSYAQKKAAFVDRQKHLVLQAPHPSPLSAHRGFLGSRPFSKINEFLVKHRQKPIDWSLSN